MKDIREQYIQGEILQIGQLLEGNLEIIDRRSNYVVVVDRMGKDYKMFLEEAAERTIVQESSTLKKKKTLKEILEGSELEYKGYNTRNLKFFDELRESVKAELEEQSSDPFANLHYLKAIDEIAGFGLMESKKELSEDEKKMLNRLIDRAKKYGHSKDSYKLTPYHDKDIRTVNPDGVEDNHPKHERDGIKKFIKADESVKSEKVATNVRNFLSEGVDTEKAEKELDSLEKDKSKQDELIAKVDDLEDIHHLYHEDDFHLFEEDLTEALSREARIKKKIAFARTKSKRERAKEIALKRLSSKPKLTQKARKAAIELLKQHISRKPLDKLSVPEKERLEAMIAKRKDLIARLARKLAPKIAQIERNRVYGQHVKEEKEDDSKEDSVKNEVENDTDDDLVDVADEEEEEGNDVDRDQRMKAHGHRMIRNFIKEEDEDEKCCDDMHESLYEELIEEESEYQGKKVKLNKPFRTPGEKSKFAVYTKNDKNNVVKVTFGDPNMSIKRDDPERRKNYRARHNCSDPGPKWKANYWSCRMWSSKSVSDILAEEKDVIVGDSNE